MKKNIILISTLFCITLSFAQQIDMKVNIFGHKFTQDGERLSWRELADATESNLEANLLIKKAKSDHTISTILNIVGGGLLGIPIGQSLSNEDPNWTLAYIGGGLTIISIPFTFSYFNKVNEGIDTYNLSLKTSSLYQFKPEFRVVANSNGLGLGIRF